MQGYRAWNKAGYQVRKGEHGIAIYAPMRFAPRDSDALDDGITAPPRLGFRVAYVFDISQVDALPGTDAALLTAPAAADSPNAHRANEQLKAFLVGHNVELEYKALAPGLLGYTNGRRITCGQGQAAHVEFATLAHETTHVLLHFPTDGSTRPDLATRETEAEAVTYLLCAQLRDRRHRCLRRVHPVLPRHTRHARRVARAHPRHRATAHRRTRHCPDLGSVYLRAARIWRPTHLTCIRVFV